MKPALRIVPSTNEAEEMLEDLIRDLFKHRDIAAKLVREYDAKIGESIKLLAKARGVIFLRPERVRQELVGE